MASGIAAVSAVEEGPETGTVDVQITAASDHLVECHAALGHTLAIFRRKLA